MSDNSVTLYDKSPIPPAKPGAPPAERNPDREISTDSSGRLNYASGAATGHVEIEIPSLPGSPNAVERLHARDFGVHVATKIERSFQRQPYLESGPQQRPSQVFRHYIGAGKGSGLIDKAVSSRMEKLASEFEQEAEPEVYFREVLGPYLHSLAPKRRT